MSTIARGQITIVDLNDAKTLNLYLGSSKPLTQIFNKENSSYTPSWSASPFLVITPELYVSGSTTNVIGDIKGTPVWKINGSTTLSTFGATAGTAAPYALTIKNNMTSVTQLMIECTVIYVDPITNVETPVKSVITFTKTENAGQLICAISYAPNGTIFKNGQTETLKAHCDMWRGSTIDNTKVSYQWYKLATDGTWSALTSSANFGCTGYTTNELTIPASAVLNFESFKCTIKDTDTASGTYNTSVSDIISFADLSDPYQIVIAAPAGDKIVNGIGSIPIIAEIWQNGEKIPDATASTKFVFSWKRFDKNGTQDTAWGTSGIKTGTTQTITKDDVTIKATFVCELSEK